MKSKEEIIELREQTRDMLNEKFGNIVFNEEPHKYYIDGKEYTPVSTIISQYENPFDEERASKSTAMKSGKTQEDVLREWKWNNKCSVIMGTRTHSFGEAYTNLMCGHTELIPEQNLPQYLKDENWLVPTFTQEFAIKDFYDNLIGSLVPIGAEFKLSTQYIKGTKPICGTADLLFYYNAENEEHSGFVIGDWKGLDVNTPIFTTDGWKTMGTVQVGDTVYDKEGKRTKVLHTSEVHHRNCYKITFNNNDTIIADNEHRWLITFGSFSRGVEEKVMTTEEIHNYIQSFNGKQIPSEKIPRIMNAKPIENEDIELPIDPYVFGCWLGDGNKVDGKITNMDKDIWDELEKRWECIGNDISGGTSVKAQTRTLFGLTQKLRENNLLKNKHIPDIYFKASYQQRLDLLRGLMDTDGYYNKVRNRFVMRTTQDWQVKATKTIASSLGIKTTVIYSKGKCNNCKKKKIFDKIDVAFSDEINPFLRKHTEKEYKPIGNHSYKWRNIVKVEEVDSVPTRCIETDSLTHTFLCGEYFLVTHNTNKELTKSFVRNNNIMMKPPFDNYFDEALSHYYLQFNLYQRMMESVGLNIITRRLIHLQHEGGYKMYPIPKIDDNIISQIIMYNGQEINI